jgi:hypothetical protein
MPFPMVPKRSSPPSINSASSSPTSSTSCSGISEDIDLEFVQIVEPISEFDQQLEEERSSQVHGKTVSLTFELQSRQNVHIGKSRNYKKKLSRRNP